MPGVPDAVMATEPDAPREREGERLLLVGRGFERLLLLGAREPRFSSPDKVDDLRSVPGAPLSLNMENERLIFCCSLEPLLLLEGRR